MPVLAAVVRVCRGVPQHSSRREKGNFTFYTAGRLSLSYKGTSRIGGRILESLLTPRWSVFHLVSLLACSSGVAFWSSSILEVVMRRFLPVSLLVSFVFLPASAVFAQSVTDPNTWDFLAGPLARYQDIIVLAVARAAPVCFTIVAITVGVSLVMRLIRLVLH